MWQQGYINGFNRCTGATGATGATGLCLLALAILALARFTTPCSVEAKLETFAVDVARERLHARRKSGLVVGKFSFCCSVHGHPAIINIDILV